MRRLREDDFPAFAQMNSDPEVMRYFPNPWTCEESRAAFERIDIHFQECGFGVYAVEVSSSFAGIVGLSRPEFESWFTPCVEILWRLQTGFWGCGLATDTAAAVLKMARGTLSISEVFAFAVPENLRSLRVMDKLGMMPCTPPAFDHPKVSDPKLKRHLVYSAKPSSQT